MSTAEPTHLEQFAEGRTAYELVLGAMLGGYLGLTISDTGLSGGTYWDLGILLFSLTMFVLSINLAGERFHRGNWRYAFGYFVGSLVFVPLSVSLSEPLGVDGNIVLTIQIVWLVLMFFEAATIVPAHIKWAKK